MEIHRHFFKKKADERIMNLAYALIKFQEVDLLINALFKPEFEFFVSKLGIIDFYSLACGGVRETKNNFLNFRD